MEANKFADLDETQLNQKLIELQKQKKTHASLLGLSIGILLYSIYKNGIGINPATIFPPLLVGFFFVISNKNKVLKNELEI